MLIARRFIAGLCLAAVAAAGWPAAGLAQTAARTPPPDFTRLVERVGPAVVNVTTVTKGETAEHPALEYFRRFMPDRPEGGPAPFRNRGLGSGFIISADGYVLTNAHVVRDAEEVIVRLADSKRELKARIVGSDRRTDIALLKVEATGLPAVTLGSADALEVGEWVVAIGSPFGFDNTITAGVVSAKGRWLPNETYVPFIQTDVAVNPGNSGGPLANLAGEVVGINSQIYTRSGGYMGVSFAIPIDVAMEVTEQLRAHGYVTRGLLGVRIQEVTQALADSFGLAAPRGALVASVEPGSPADKAGLKAGDVIVAYAGKKIVDVNELPRLVGRTVPGNDARIEVWRKGATHTLTATIGAMEGERAAAGAVSRLGVVLSEAPATQRKRLGIGYGLVVESVRATDSPLRRGDVIVAVNEAEFANRAEFDALIADEQPGDTVALLVHRGNASLYVPVEVGAG